MSSRLTPGRWACGAACLALLFGAGPACRDRQAPTLSASAPWFVDATKQAGLAFTHHNGRTGQFYYPEVIAPGVALFDMDGDGDLDAYLVQSGALTDPPEQRPEIVRPVAFGRKAPGSIAG